jgi:hypothetical protein
MLETIARPRSAFAFTGIEGEGRILLAACATHESAWEQPGTGHGLLTHAVIEAWTNPAFPENADRFAIAYDEVFAEVEAGAAVSTQSPESTRGECLLGR